MRKFGLFLCLSLLFAFTGCSDSDDVEEQGGTVLAKPSVAVTTTTSSSFKVAWDAVPNAESYKYRLSQENETGDELVVQPENSTSATALAFGDLDPKTKYILRVKAVARRRQRSDGFGVLQNLRHDAGRRGRGADVREDRRDEPDLRERRRGDRTFGREPLLLAGRRKQPDRGQERP